jgi:hypothetical protein
VLPNQSNVRDLKALCDTNLDLFSTLCFLQEEATAIPKGVTAIPEEEVTAKKLKIFPTRLTPIQGVQNRHSLAQ